MPSRRSYILLLLLLPLLAGCAAAQSPMPGFVVMLTQDIPLTAGRCSGVALAPQTVLTAAHCARLPRVVTQAGKETRVTTFRRSVEDDAAILYTASALDLAAYATLAEPTAGVAYLWGTCPYFWAHQIRTAIYVGSIERSFLDGPHVVDRWLTDYEYHVCGGDSGGILEQNGAVVGLISALDSDFFFVPYGVTFYAVSGERLAALAAN